MVTTPIRRILWTEKLNASGNIKSWYGHVNGNLIYIIDKFKTDDALMTSRVVPLRPRIITNPDPEELKEQAQILLEAFIKSFNYPED